MDQLFSGFCGLVPQSGAFGDCRQRIREKDTFPYLLKTRGGTCFWTCFRPFEAKYSDG
jgi:hypothetical protein